MTDIKAQYLTKTTAREECGRLAEERGFYSVVILLSGRILLTGDGLRAVDYVEEILAPRGLVPFGYTVRDWTDAKRLLGMLPPSRG